MQNYTKIELMEWYRVSVRHGFFKTAKKILDTLIYVLPTQGKPGGYALYIASYDTEVHASGFTAYVQRTFVEHRNVKGEMSHKYSDPLSFCSRLTERIPQNPSTDEKENRS